MWLRSAWIQSPTIVLWGTSITRLHQRKREPKHGAASERGLDADLTALATRYDRGTGSTTVMDWEYLLLTARVS